MTDLGHWEPHTPKSNFSRISSCSHLEGIPIAIWTGSIFKCVVWIPWKGNWISLIPFLLIAPECTTLFKGNWMRIQPSWCSRKSLHYHGIWAFKKDALCSNERLNIRMGALNASQQAFKSLPIIQSSIARAGSVCCGLAEMPDGKTGSLAWY